MLSKQPNMQYSSHWFFHSRLQRRALLRAGSLAEIEDQEIPRQYMRLSSEGFSHFLEFLEGAKRECKTPFAHKQPHAMLMPEVMSDHARGPSTSSSEVAAELWIAEMPGSWRQHGNTRVNPTSLPDWILLRPGTVPTLNFCHSLLLIERLYRGFTVLPAFAQAKSHELISIGATLRWQRLMYDWYSEHGTSLDIDPIVLDADDYTGPEEESVMRNLCRRVHCLNLDSVTYSWPKTTPEEIAKLAPEMQQAHRTILASEGVMSGYDSRGLHAETEIAKWVEKYGQEEADHTRELVDKAMPDYEYLRAHRLRPDDST